MNMLLTLVYKSLCTYVFPVPTSIYLGVELPGLSLERLDLVYKLRVPENQQKGWGETEKDRGGGGGRSWIRFTFVSITHFLCWYNPNALTSLHNYCLCTRNTLADQEANPMRG